MKSDGRLTDCSRVRPRLVVTAMMELERPRPPARYVRRRNSGTDAAAHHRQSSIITSTHLRYHAAASTCSATLCGICNGFTATIRNNHLPMMILYLPHFHHLQEPNIVVCTILSNHFTPAGTDQRISRYQDVKSCFVSRREDIWLEPGECEKDPAVGIEEQSVTIYLQRRLTKVLFGKLVLKRLDARFSPCAVLNSTTARRLQQRLMLERFQKRIGHTEDARFNGGSPDPRTFMGCSSAN
jgi:hypothetical protein